MTLQDFSVDRRADLTVFNDKLATLDAFIDGAFRALSSYVLMMERLCHALRH